MKNFHKQLFTNLLTIPQVGRHLQIAIDNNIAGSVLIVTVVGRAQFDRKLFIALIAATIISSGRLNYKVQVGVSGWDIKCATVAAVFPIE